MVVCPTWLWLSLYTSSTRTSNSQAWLLNVCVIWYIFFIWPGFFSVWKVMTQSHKSTQKHARFRLKSILVLIKWQAIPSRMPLHLCLFSTLLSRGFTCCGSWLFKLRKIQGQKKIYHIDRKSTSLVSHLVFLHQIFECGS